jgi:hypothetical protein
MYKKSNSILIVSCMSFALIISGILSITIGNPSTIANAGSPISSYSTVYSKHYKSPLLENHLKPMMYSNISYHPTTQHCPIKVNNSDFYYKGGNFSVQNTSPSEVYNVTVTITLPAGVKILSSSLGGYNQHGNILQYHISSIAGYSNIDTSYVHDYLNYSHLSTTISCGSDSY